MSTHAGDIFFDLKLNRKPYEQGMRSVDKGAGVLAAKIGKKLAAGLSIAAFGKFIKDTTAAGASLNAMNAIVDAALPNMTKQVDNWAKHAGAAFGLSETNAKGYIGKFASMASAMGYTEKQAYKMSTALTGLAGDVASYYHISQDEAFTKLNAVFTGETESLKQLGVIMTQSALDAFALSNGFGKVTSQMTETEKTTLRYQFVLDRLKLTAGDFAKYANTWSGSIATIKLNWSNFMATVGQGIINILLPLLQVIAKVSNALTALGSRFLAWTEKVTGKSKGLSAIKNAVSNTFGKSTQKDLAGASNALGNVGGATGGVGKSAKSAKKAVQALKRELMGFDQITKLTKQDSSTGTSGSGGIGGGSGISAGGIDFSEADADVESFSERAKDYLSNIKLPPALTEALGKLKDAFSGLFDLLSNAGKWVWDNVLQPLGQWTINKLAPELVTTLANAITLVTNILKLLGEILEPLWNLIVKPFFAYLGNQAIAAIKDVNVVLEFLAKLIGNAAEGFKKFKELATDAVEVVKKKWEEIKQNVKDLVPKISLKIPTWSDIKSSWNSLIDNFKDKKAEVKLSIGTTWADLKKKWNDLLDKFDGKTAKVKLSIGTTWGDLKKKWNNLLDNFGGKTVTVGVKVASFTKSLKKAWDALKAHFKKDGGVYANGRWQKVQKYAGGGAPGHGQLFWAREKGPELVGTIGGHTAVMNNNQIVSSVSAGVARAMMGLKLQARIPELASVGQRSNTVVSEAQTQNNTEALLKQLIELIKKLDLNIELDGEKVKKNVVQRINAHTRTTGECEIVI